MFTWQTLVAGIALMVAGIIILKPRQPKSTSPGERGEVDAAKSARGAVEGMTRGVNHAE